MSQLAEGRRAFDAETWSAACALLAAADAETPLEPEDLNRLAMAAYLVGDDARCIEALTRAHAGFLERGEIVHAAGSAFWLGFSMMEYPSRRAQAGGWLARAQRLIEDAETPCVEAGWLLCTFGYQRVGEGEFASARDAFAQAADIGARFHNRDLIAFARHGQGRTLLALHHIPEGFALLDEVMVAVTAGEIAPIIAGVIYCSVIGACRELFDLRRAQEWTTALQQWCAARPDVVAFRGQCLIRRSELMMLHGEWPEALAEARRACEYLAAHPGHPAVGMAHYQRAEMHRLRGEVTDADEAYRLAAQAGGKAHPGLALLRLAQGQTASAEAAIRPALLETRARHARVPVLRAGVEILVAAEEISGARAAADELSTIAADLGAPLLRAAAMSAIGAVALADKQAEPAVEALRDAASAWQELDAPYELARVRVLTGLAYRQLGDRDGAQLEFDAAHETFDKVGAAPDASRVASLTATTRPPASGALTGREVEVLRLIATGATNRAIAARLTISEKTVARHVSNIFTKLDLSSRSAATAYAYEHKLL